METITVRYRKLFQVEVLLHHLLDQGEALFDDLSNEVKLRKLGRYQLGQWMEIKPTEATKLAMSGLGWTFKHSATGFLLAASASSPESNTPKVAPQADLKLDFEMVANNAGFAAFSAFPLPGNLNGNRAFYLFDNAATHGASADAYPALALAPPVYNNSSTYEAGSMVSSGGNRFVAKKKTKGNAPVAGAHWAGVPEAVRYANGAHLKARTSFPISENAFGIVRIHCSNGLGDFGLFDGSDFRSPIFKIRLRKSVN